jgi:hypothetical protein
MVCHEGQEYQREEPTTAPPPTTAPALSHASFEEFVASDECKECTNDLYCLEEFDEVCYIKSFFTECVMSCHGVAEMTPTLSCRECVASKVENGPYCRLNWDSTCLDNTAKPQCLQSCYGVDLGFSEANNPTDPEFSQACEQCIVDDIKDAFCAFDFDEVCVAETFFEDCVATCHAGATGNADCTDCVATLEESDFCRTQWDKQCYVDSLLPPCRDVCYGT